ncbi:SRPBCC family protein [Bacillus kexueae]|uniref:SRPBCC family protein n=1 Tax=Aeribacillus kexueae TaxID=2078952 RepID=UPI001FAEDA04|nr:SRPBCC domain-containing protein [Bacillus kexueae]
MITMSPDKLFTLELKREYAVSAKRMFEAWTKPEQFKMWMGPKGYQVAIEEMNVEAKGTYRLVMENAEGQKHVLVGKYLEVMPNEKLVFTWKWESDEQEFPETVVTVLFKEISEKSMELAIVHDCLPSEEAAQNHNQGWSSTLDDKLATYF